MTVAIFESSSNVPEFRVKIKAEYPEIATKALKTCLAFPTPYLCEAGFSATKAK